MGDKLKLLLSDADETITTTDFENKNDGTYGYLSINCIIPPIGMLGVGLVQYDTLLLDNGIIVFILKSM